MSGASSVAFNEALCQGSADGGQIARTVHELNALRTPVMLVVTGEALRDAQQLVDLGWVCIDAMPFMARRTDGLAKDSSVRQLDAADLSRARQLVANAFDFPRPRRVALPDML